MNPEQETAVRTCVALSAAGKIHFGEVVTQLAAAGVERYHVDYDRMESTYYAREGGSCVEPLGLTAGEIADAFSAAEIEAAVRAAQRGEAMYPEFTRRALAAGCVGYFVHLTGQCVQYFGRKGEIHTEYFPGAKRV